MTGLITLVVAIRQRRTSAEIEYIKQRLEGEQKAWLELMKPCFFYYYILQGILIDGPYSKEKIEEANQKMIEASAQLVYVSDADWAQWFAFWSHAQRIASAAGKCTSKEYANKVWEDNAKLFGERLRNLRARAAAAL